MLGVIIDENVNFNEQCNNVVKKCQSALWSLRPLKYVLNQDQKLIVIQALVHSIFSYGCAVWLVGKKNLESVNKIIRTCSRFVSGKLKYDSISDDVNAYGWLNAKNVVAFEVSKLTFKILNECGPKVFNNYLNMESKNVCTRNKSYILPPLNVKTQIGKKSFRYRAAKTMMTLPNNLQENVYVTNLVNFKKQVKNVLIDKQRTERMTEILALIDEYEFDNLLNVF